MGPGTRRCPGWDRTCGRHDGEEGQRIARTRRGPSPANRRAPGSCCRPRNVCVLQWTSMNTWEGYGVHDGITDRPCPVTLDTNGTHGIIAVSPPALSCT